MNGLIGKKLGMTSVYDENGKRVACTVVQAGPCVVTQVKTEANDGYTAIQMAYGDKKEKHTNSAEAGHFAKAKTTGKSEVMEFRDFSTEGVEIGAVVDVNIFEVGDYVDVVGTSKGKGFQGVVKRHGFSGVGESTHLSTTVCVHLVLLVLVLSLVVYSKECVWLVEQVEIE